MVVIVSINVGAILFWRIGTLDDQIELLKARIRQADKNIQQLEGALAEKGSESYKNMANQVLIELREIHQEADRLKFYIGDDVYNRIDKKVVQFEQTSIFS